MDTNICLVSGHLTREPEFREVNDDFCACNFGLAVQGKKDTVSFFEIKTYRRLAEVCRDYLNKGSRILVQGRAHQDRWEQDEGIKRQKVVLIANEVKFLNDRRKEGEEAN